MLPSTSSDSAGPDALGRRTRTCSPMKLLPLFLAAAGLLLSACSSFRPVPVTYKPAAPPVLAGNKVTVWGELPSYEDRGYYFQNLQRANLVDPFRGHVVLDLKVDAEGRVMESAIFESSGDAAVDRAMLNVHRLARYTLRLGPDDPAPYVVRYKVVVNASGRPPRDRESNVDQTNPNQLGGPNPQSGEYSTNRF